MDRRKELVEAVLESLRAEVEQGIDELEDGTPMSMDRIEQVVEQIKARLGRELGQRILDQLPDTPENRLSCPQCGQPARFRDQEERVLISFLGELRLGRRRYRCGSGHGFAPLDRRLGLDAGATTPALRVFLAGAAADGTFEAAKECLWETRGIRVGESTTERVTVATGQRLQQREQERGAADEAGTPCLPEHRPSVVHLSMDGVYAPLRDPWKRDGSAGKLQCRYGECKVGVAYETRTDGRGRSRLAWREYTATCGDIAAFRPQMAALAERCGAFQAGKIVFLADGLPCNWTLAADYFPGAVEIVDWIHAVEHLRTVRDEFFGGGTPLGKSWLADRKRELWEGQVEQVVAACQDLPAATPEQRETQRRETGFFTHNQERMRYQSFREGGYQIASGVMEASCRTVVNQRLDRSGMHWHPDVADAMVALRAARLSSTRPNLREFCTAPH